MKVIVLGDCLLAVSIARFLFRQQYDVTLVIDPQFCSFSVHDLNLPFPSIEAPLVSLSSLEQAGADDAELIIALSQFDEKNIVLATIAERIFHVPARIVSLRSFEFDALSDLFGTASGRSSAIIHPEHMVAQFCLDIIRYPQLVELFSLFDGRFRLAVVTVPDTSSFCGHLFSQIFRNWFSQGIFFLALSRSGRLLSFKDETRILPKDKILFLALPHTLDDFLKDIFPHSAALSHVLINSAQGVGFRLAKSLQNVCSVRLFETNRRIYKNLFHELNNVLVLDADVCDPLVLIEEGIEGVDLFLAVSPDDKLNMMSAFMAKRMGAKRTALLTQYDGYTEYLSGGEACDLELSYSAIVLSKIMGFLRFGDVRGVYRLNFARAEVLEIVLHGNPKHSRAVGRKMKDIKLPSGVIICGVVRGSVTFFFDSSLVLEEGDGLILLDYRGDVRDHPEQIFQVDAGYFE